MPKLHERHNISVAAEHEFDAVWRSIDQLTVRENRLRQQVAGIPGAPPAAPKSTTATAAPPEPSVMMLMGA